MFSCNSYCHPMQTILGKREKRGTLSFNFIETDKKWFESIK